MKPILGDIKEETDTITVWNFNIPLTSVDRSFRQNISKKTLALKKKKKKTLTLKITSAQIKLIDIQTVSSKTAE